MDSRGSFDLAPEIMCLVDIHFPRSSQWHNHILLQAENLVRLDERVFPVPAVSRVALLVLLKTHAARAVFSSMATLMTSNKDLSKR